MAEKLTTVQEHATQIPVGGVIVVSAGAGTGKTRVLSETVAVEMIQKKRVDIREIVVLTFTVKAAGEMAERIESRLCELASETADKSERKWLLENAANAADAHIETIAAFSGRILRDHPNETGFDPSFEVLEPNRERELAGIVARQCFLKWIDNPPHPKWRETAKGLYFQDWEDEFFKLSSHIETRGAMSVAGLLKGKKVGDESDIEKITKELRNRAQNAFNKSLNDVKSLADFLESTLPDIIDQAGKAKYAEKAQDVLNDLPDLTKWLQNTDPDWSAEIALKIPSWKSFGNVKGDASITSDAIKDLRAHFDGKSGADTPKHELLKFTDLETKLIDNKVAFAHALVEFHSEFKAARRDAAKLSFSDCESETLKLLKNNPDVRAKYNNQFRYVVVDEFQDINPLQKELIFSLARGDGEDAENLFVVGDERQSIYGFRDADYRLIRDLRKKFEGVSTEGMGSRVLHENFRSRPPLLDFVNHIFQSVWLDGTSVEHTDLTPPVDNPDLRGGGGGDESRCVELNLIVGDNAASARESEARVIASRLSSIVANGEINIVGKDTDGNIKSRPVEYGDCAILIRRKGPFKYYEEAFTDFGIPYQIESGGGFWEVQEISDIIALLGCLSSAPDNLDFAVLLRSPWVGISDDGLYELMREIHSSPIRKTTDRKLLVFPQWETAIKNIGFSNASDRAKLSHFRSWYFEIKKQLAGRIPVGQLIEKALINSGYSERVMVQDGGRIIRANIEKLISILKSETAMFDPGEAVEYFRWLRSRDTADAQAVVEPVETSGSVTLATVHGAKGREWPVVVIADLNAVPGGGGATQVSWDEDLGVSFRWLDSVSGSTEPPSGFIEADENRKVREAAENERVFYVALTRPRDYLILSSGIKENKAGDKFLISKNSWLGGLEKVFDENGISLNGSPDDIKNGSSDIIVKTKSIVGDTETDKEIIVRRIYHEVTPIASDLKIDERTVPSSDLITALKNVRKLPSGTSERYIVTATEVTLFDKCPRMYAYRSILNVPAVHINDSDESDDEYKTDTDDKIELPASEWGSLIHKILELVPFDSGVTEIERITSEQLENPIYIGIELPGDAAAIVQKTLELPIFDEIQKCDLAGTVKREFRLLGSIDGGQSILGTIDLYAERDDKLILIDYKSGKVNPNNAESTADRYKTQLALYSLLASSRRGVEPENVETHIIFTSIPTDIRVKISSDDLIDVRTLLKRLVDSSAGNHFTAAASESNCKWCDYRAICPHCV